MLSFQFKREASSLRCAAFEITDTQNNTFTTELPPIRPSEEITLYRRTVTLPEPLFDIHYRLIATSAHSVNLFALSASIKSPLQKQPWRPQRLHGCFDIQLLHPGIVLMHFLNKAVQIITSPCSSPAAAC